MQLQALLAVFFAIAACFILVFALGGLLNRRGDAGKLVSRRVASLRREHEDQQASLERAQQVFSTLTWLNRLLSGRLFVAKVDQQIKQANVGINVAVLLLLAGVSAATGFWLGAMFAKNILLQAAIAGACGYLPFMWVDAKRNKRMAKLEQQLPDALDLIARVLTAGHGFAQGMRIVADEFDEPLGPEFRVVMEEISFGLATEHALLSMAHRLNNMDLRFFVIAVNIQRETGGNLAEITGNIARLLRERSKLRGKVKTLTAEGRLTAWILMALPFGVGSLVYMVNKDFMSVLFTDPTGKMMIQGALLLMVIGALVLKKMVNIRV